MCTWLNSHLDSNCYVVRVNHFLIKKLSEAKLLCLLHFCAQAYKTTRVWQLTVYVNTTVWKYYHYVIISNYIPVHSCWGMLCSGQQSSQEHLYKHNFIETFSPPWLRRLWLVHFTAISTVWSKSYIRALHQSCYWYAIPLKITTLLNTIQ